MSDELRAKIMEILQEQDATNVPRAADEILALFTPPATAKLPEGKTNRERAIELIDSWMVACDRLLHEPDKQRLVTMIESALTAAIAAPPVPGESKSVYDEDEHIDILVKERDAARTRISQLEAELKAAGECDRCGKPALKLCRGCAAEVMPGEKPTTQHVLCTMIDERDARIAELEAEVASNAQREIIVLIESFGWKHDGNGHWTHKNFNGPYGYRAAAESTLYRGSRAEPTTATKPDPRLTAPNGRAMVRYMRNTQLDNCVWGEDDEGQWWYYCGHVATKAWAKSSDMPACIGMSFVVPCTCDGTPITKTKPEPTIFSIPEIALSPDKMYTIEQDGDTFKIAEVPQPDPLARAVTDADLLKLADLLHLGGAKFVADCVREVARAAGGSKPA